MDLKYSKLQNKSKIRKFWKRINQELNAPSDFIWTLLLKWTTKNLFCTPGFTKLHPSYHLNSTQPDHAMWQFPPFKISQPEQATCHNPPLTKLTSQILPRHHLLHLTHEILTLIFLLSYHHHGSHQPPFTDLAVSRATTTVHAPSTCSRTTTPETTTQPATDPAPPSFPHLTPPFVHATVAAASESKPPASIFSDSLRHHLHATMAATAHLDQQLNLASPLDLKRERSHYNSSTWNAKQQRKTAPNLHHHHCNILVHACTCETRPLQQQRVRNHCHHRPKPGPPWNLHCETRRRRNNTRFCTIPRRKRRPRRKTATTTVIAPLQPKCERNPNSRERVCTATCQHLIG